MMNAIRNRKRYDSGLIEVMVVCWLIAACGRGTRDPENDSDTRTDAPNDTAGDTGSETQPQPGTDSETGTSTPEDSVSESDTRTAPHTDGGADTDTDTISDTATLPLPDGGIDDGTDTATETGSDTEAPPDAGSDAGVIYPHDTWPYANPADQGLDPTVLEEAAAFADAANSHCLMVTRAGRIVGEWYFDDWLTDTEQNVFSVTKSVTGTLVGAAQDQGLLDINEPASWYIEEWIGTESEAVTIKQLLSQTSGRFFSIASDYLSMAAAAADKTAYAIGLDQQQTPGTYWEYNNSAVQTLERVMEIATGMPLSEFADLYLFSPLGMASHLGADEAGNTLAFSNMSASCQDLMRFGYLVLRHGRWDGAEIISEEWLAEATAPSSALNTAYGYLWWLNRDGHYVEATDIDGTRVEADGQIMPGLSENIIMARGLQSQLIVIDPDHDLIYTRIGGESDIIEALVSGVPLTDAVFVNDMTTLVLGALVEP